MAPAGQQGTRGWVTGSLGTKLGDVERERWNIAVVLFVCLLPSFSLLGGKQ